MKRSADSRSLCRSALEHLSGRREGLELVEACERAADQQLPRVRAVLNRIASRELGSRTLNRDGLIWLPAIGRSLPGPLTGGLVAACLRPQRRH